MERKLHKLHNSLIKGPLCNSRNLRSFLYKQSFEV